MTDLEKLIESVEAGIIPRSDLDAFIPLFGLSVNANNALDAYRGSLDAAKALHDALLPGWAVEISCKPFGIKPHQWFCRISDDHTGWGNGKYFNAAKECPARAWLLAILKAHKVIEQ